VVVFVMLGYLLGVFGLSLDATDSNVRVIEIFLFALGAIGVSVLVIRNRRRREREAAQAGDGESMERVV